MLQAKTRQKMRALPAEHGACDPVGDQRQNAAQHQQDRKDWQKNFFIVPNPPTAVFFNQNTGYTLKKMRNRGKSLLWCKRKKHQTDF